MKYFLDTEFLEGTQKKFFFGHTKPTIDLISIGIVAEDGREYYAVSSEFNLKEAWNRWQPRTGEGDRNLHDPKNYWIRDNVLLPIFEEHYIAVFGANMPPFCYEAMKKVIDAVGQTREEMAYDIFRFIHQHVIDKWDDHLAFAEEIVHSAYQQGEKKHEFYGYYADYDWVVFCWIFGKMMDLPDGFPMYCNDLKQDYDRIQARIDYERHNGIPGNYQGVAEIKLIPSFPKLTKEHNALEDARWNKKVYEFLMRMY